MTDIELEKERERAYLDGVRSASLRMLRDCLRNLGHGYDKLNGSEVLAVRLIAEREEAVSGLRRLCSDFGDTDWPDELNLSDVIEKHLANHLYAMKG